MKDMVKKIRHDIKNAQACVNVHTKAAALT